LTVISVEYRTKIEQARIKKARYAKLSVNFKLNIDGFKAGNSTTRLRFIF
jgi:hypothetical protein